MLTLTRKHWIWLALALGHLTLSGVGCLFEDSFRGGWTSVVREYGYFSGGMARLKFFSPNVGSELRLTYVAADGKGRFLKGNILTSRGETNLRLAKLVDMFWSPQTTPEIRESLAASWAGKILAAHPDFTTIDMKLDAFELPSMQQFRSGKRSHWLPYYNLRFELPQRNASL